jgi:Gp157 protein
MKLYEISNQIIQNQLQEIDTDSDEHHAKLTLDLLEGEFKDKCIAIASYIKNMEQESNAVADAIKSMQSRKNRIEKKIDFFKGYLLENLKRVGMYEIKDSPYFEIKIKRNPPSIDVYDEEAIPNEYKVQEIKILVDKKHLKEDLEHGLIVEGARIVQRERVEIK